MRYFKHHIGDYAAATQHLSFLEDAALHRMLRLYYQTENPLPGDLKALARLVGARSEEEKEAVATIAGEFFTLEEDGFHQRRCDAELAGHRERTLKASEYGKRGGRPAKTEKPSLSDSKANHQPSTTNHDSEPVGSAAHAAAGDGQERKPREVIFADCLPWLNARQGRDCRSLLGKWLAETRDDAAMLRLLREAEAESPIDPAAWIAGRVRPRGSPADQRAREVELAIQRGLAS